MARRLKQSPDTVTSMTQSDVGPTEVVKRCGHAEPFMWCLLSDPWAPNEMADGIQ